MKALVLDPIKLTGNGLQDKSGWTVSTNMSSAQDSVPPADDGDPDAPAPKPASELMVDGKADTVYTGASDGEDPVITLDMGKPTEVTSLRYTLGAGAEGSAIGDYRIETSLDGENYTLIKEGALSLDKDGRASLYFDNGKDPWICTYDARYLRITAVGQAGRQLSVAELDVFGPSGDDVFFLDANGGAAGILKSDFVYQKADENLDKQFIPKGSLVFTGSYKGNPAYNVVVLYDENGNVVGGVNADGSTVASQIIMAPEPGDAMLGDVSEGSWVYWIEPGDLASMKLPDACVDLAWSNLAAPQYPPADNAARRRYAAPGRASRRRDPARSPRCPPHANSDSYCRGRSRHPAPAQNRGAPAGAAVDRRSAAAVHHVAYSRWPPGQTPRPPPAYSLWPCSTSSKRLMSSV